MLCKVWKNRSGLPIAAIAWSCSFKLVSLTFCPDHYQYTAGDFARVNDSIVMTEKDFVKCKEFATDKMYYLPVTANLTDTFWDDFFRHPALIKFT